MEMRVASTVFPEPELMECAEGEPEIVASSTHDLMVTPQSSPSSDRSPGRFAFVMELTRWRMEVGQDIRYL
jgi:hypothetical protein